MFKKIILFSFLLLIGFNGFSDTLQIGQQILPFELENQHGKRIKVGDSAKILLFTKEKTPSKLLNTFLLGLDPKYLTIHNAFFIADISGMPFLVRKMIAIPKMKKSPYDILLAKKEATLAFVPYKKDYITILKKRDGQIESINFVNKMSELKNTLK